MPLTRRFRDLVKARADRDPKFRAALLQEALEAFVRGNSAEGKAALRTYVNATIGFEQLGQALSKKPQSLMRMLSANGNPSLENIALIMSTLRKHEGIELRVGAE